VPDFSVLSSGLTACAGETEDGSEVTADTMGCSGIIISGVVFAPHPINKKMPDKILSNKVLFALIFAPFIYANLNNFLLAYCVNADFTYYARIY
jgi:hypothetical protein